MMPSAPPGRTALETAQLAQLRRLLRALVPDNRFYAARLREAGLGGDVASLDEFRSTMPLTTKQDLVADQREHPPYGSNLSYPLERYTRYSQTSATSGLPLRWLDTPESWQWMLDNWRCVYDAAEVIAADRVFFAFSFGPFLGFWTAFEAATQRGCLCLPGGGMSSAARIRVILDNHATILCCTPTYAIRLAQVAEEEGIDLSVSRVRRIIVAGEPGGSVPATRAHIESRWPGARVVDHHGMTEVGPVSYQCPLSTSVLHVIESSYLTEIINPATQTAVPPGERGELVLTTLGRLGSPLLRYRTGDLVQFMPPQRCACGRYDLTLAGGILGRCDDMICVRGVNIFPAAVDQVVRGFPQIAEYRTEISERDAMTQMKLIIETGGDHDHITRQLERALRDAFNLRVEVQAVAPGTMPRFEMKARRWIRIP